MEHASAPVLDEAGRFVTQIFGRWRWLRTGAHFWSRQALTRRGWHRHGAGELTLSSAILLKTRTGTVRLVAGTVLAGRWTSNQPIGRFAVVGPDGTAMRHLLFRLGGGRHGLSSRLVIPERICLFLLFLACVRAGLLAYVLAPPPSTVLLNAA